MYCILCQDKWDSTHIYRRGVQPIWTRNNRNKTPINRRKLTSFNPGLPNHSAESRPIRPSHLAIRPSRGPPERVNGSASPDMSPVGMIRPSPQPLGRVVPSFGGFCPNHLVFVRATFASDCVCSKLPLPRIVFLPSNLRHGLCFHPSYLRHGLCFFRASLATDCALSKLPSSKVRATFEQPLSKH